MFETKVFGGLDRANFGCRLATTCTQIFLYLFWVEFLLGNGD